MKLSYRTRLYFRTDSYVKRSSLHCHDHLMHVLKRTFFGLWDEFLGLHPPPCCLPYHKGRQEGLYHWNRLPVNRHSAMDCCEFHHSSEYHYRWMSSCFNSFQRLFVNGYEKPFLSVSCRILYMLTHNIFQYNLYDNQCILLLPGTLLHS